MEAWADGLAGAEGRARQAVRAQRRQEATGTGATTGAKFVSTTFVGAPRGRCLLVKRLRETLWETPWVVQKEEIFV